MEENSKLKSDIKSSSQEHKVNQEKDMKRRKAKMSLKGDTKMNEKAENANQLAIKNDSQEKKGENLSGGNQQKVVIGKWLATRPKIIILDEPTKGIDIGSKAAVHEFMSELTQEGLAVIMVSSELPEVMGMADRIIVMREGLMVKEFDRSEFTAEKIVSAATGVAGGA